MRRSGGAPSPALPARRSQPGAPRRRSQAALPGFLRQRRAAA
ncbi:hypothetical protein EYF80_065742 [Liparis tanakae]|uniref:Uncharacterized protein n=1 Tax=Liparis tanakae TaxID=230148 RepID=A0A4Z2E697_9TELE|nr:hypothetical protein EYF80_065742 [Liparis tanakae]